MNASLGRRVDVWPAKWAACERMGNSLGGKGAAFGAVEEERVWGKQFNLPSTT